MEHLIAQVEVKTEGQIADLPIDMLALVGGGEGILINI
jgi:hypothetical protein